MNKLVVIILLSLHTLTYGQATKLITDNKNKEEYYVLKANKTIRHGNYKKFSLKQTTIINGYYKNGVKDSIWEFYDFNGELEQKYDFTKKNLIYYKPNKNNPDNKFKVINGNDTVETNLSSPPLYLGGDLLMFSFLYMNIRYPALAVESGISGDVIISVTISKDGRATDLKVIKGIGYGCDEEALKVAKMIPNNWIPGALNGQTVTCEYLLTTKFKLIDH